MTRQEIAFLIVKGETPQGIKNHGYGYKTACTTAVLAFFGIGKDRFHFCQFVDDMVRIFNADGWKCQALHRRKEIKGKAVNSLPKLVGRGYYLVQTKGHAFLAYVSDKKELSFPVQTAPAPTKTDQRRILTLHKITTK